MEINIANQLNSNLQSSEETNQEENVFLARENQSVEEHLLSTAKYSEIFASVFGCPKTAYACGVLHDYGKYTKKFQKYLLENIQKEHSNIHEKPPKKTIHAHQGAKILFDLIKDDNYFLADVLSNIIYSHHGGLSDILQDGKRVSLEKVGKKEIVADCNEISQIPEVSKLLSKIEKTKIIEEIVNKKCKPFELHLLIKMLFSCLIDADRCSAAGLEPKEDVPDWNLALNLFYANLKNLGNKSPLDCVRTNISMQCKENGMRLPKGIFTLSVPTGAGKTLSSLRFALEHAKKHGFKKIIYVIPYLSIIDQTAKVFKDIFQDKYDNWILEHHSNVEVFEKNDLEAEDRYNILTSRWDSPIILTTMVQFLETIYSNRASALRKFHNMSESVFIFDEIQALPINCTYLFTKAVNFLQKNAGCSFVLCSATQPQLDKLDFSDNHDIVTLSDDEKKLFKRVNIIDHTKKALTSSEIADFAKSLLQKGKNTLVIVNTKKVAEQIYDAMDIDRQENKFYLSTNMCSAHRIDVLKRIREKLSESNAGTAPIVCVSTQLIEAGVDVSFNAVIRSEAGLDSIVQAAGRCNRNGESLKPEEVYVVDAYDESLKNLPEIDSGKSVTKRILGDNEGKDFLNTDIIAQYYQYYYGDEKQLKKMPYPCCEGTTQCKLLGKNESEKNHFFEINEDEYMGYPFAFQTASENFSVISGKHIGVVVPYGNASSLVDKFKEANDFSEKKRILKELQRYSITVYANRENEITPLCENVEDTFYFLSSSHYDENKGFKINFII